MIFLTVGTQLPFDRFIKLVDLWAKRNPSVEIYAQIGKGEYLPKHMKFCRFLDEKAYKEQFDNASIVLAHAAMGSVITSLIASKPIIVFPRIAALGEHRNEHQLATSRNLENFDVCYVTYNENELFTSLDNVTSLRGGTLAPYANPDLLKSIETFILAEA